MTVSNSPIGQLDREYGLLNHRRTVLEGKGAFEKDRVFLFNVGCCLCCCCCWPCQAWHTGRTIVRKLTHQPLAPLREYEIFDPNEIYMGGQCCEPPEFYLKYVHSMEHQSIMASMEENRTQRKTLVGQEEEKRRIRNETMASLDAHVFQTLGGGTRPALITCILDYVGEPPPQQQMQ